MFSKFSEEAQKILLNAKKEMQELKHPYVGSEHLFLSLLKYNKQFSKKMKDYGVTYNRFKEKLIEIVGEGNEENNWFLYTPLLKRIIETALLISKESSSRELTSEYLIYAIFEEGEGIAIRILDNMEIDISEIQSYYLNLISDKKKSVRKKLLVEEFGIDLTKKAEDNKLDPVVGRDKELKRIMEILCRRSKNNPLLIGAAGVGKTALVEELARMISKGMVPDKLKNKRIISVSIAALVSGTKYRGEFEERITTMLKELEECDDIFLFIDELHTIMGAGGAEGAIDAANIFKPALSRGKIRLIGATTIDEYKKTIEKDKAMERRFQNVFITEPNDKEVLDILKTLKPIYEEYHNVKIDNELLNSIIDLSNKYVYDRYQPDKSIDILDEVCSRMSLSSSKESHKLNSYKEELSIIKASKKNYLIHRDFESASKIKQEEKNVLSKINNLELKKSSKNSKCIKISDIVSVISEKTGIPIYSFGKDERKYVKELDNYLHNNIIGQDNAINELIKMTKRMRFGYKNDNKPVSFLFVGPTGVGKTKLALEYSKKMFGNRIVRFDMSEYKDSSSINKILGSNAGYIGYDDGKNKLEEVRNNPHAVILLDEIEKAHPSVLNLFLQILDEGSIEDNKGNIVCFNNNIIIMTSNVGFTQNDIGFTQEINDNDTKLKEILSVELLNRIKKVIYFNKLTYDDIYSILKIKIDSVKKKFKERNIKIHINENTINKMIDASRYLEYGARKLDQVLEDTIDNYVIDKIIDGKKEIYIN